MSWRNRILGSALIVGMLASASVAETVYSVREGDTLESVAKAHQTTEAKVQELNPHLAEQAFAPGLVLLLPETLQSQMVKQSPENDPTVVAGVLKNPPKASAVPVTAAEKQKLAAARRRSLMASRRGKRVRAISQTAKSYLGTPYLMGGTTRRAIDCSAFTQNVFRAHGISIPRTADVQYNKGKHVPRGQEKPGDLVFFETYLPGASHVGIYMGQGKFIHASSSRGVTITPLNSYYFGPRYLGAKRLF